MNELLSSGEVAHLPHRIPNDKYGRRRAMGKDRENTTVTIAAGEIHGQMLELVAEILRSNRIFAQMTPPNIY